MECTRNLITEKKNSLLALMEEVMPDITILIDHKSKDRIKVTWYQTTRGESKHMLGVAVATNKRSGS